MSKVNDLALFYGWEDARVWAPWNQSLDMHLSYQSRYPLSSHPQFPQGSSQASLAAQRVKRLPAMRGSQVRSLGREDSFEKETATRSGTLAWKIPWAEKPGGLQSMGSQRVRNDWAPSLSLSPQGVAVVHGCQMIGVLSFLNPLRVTCSLWRAAVRDDCDSLIYWYGRKYSISCTNARSLKLNV